MFPEDYRSLVAAAIARGSIHLPARAAADPIREQTRQHMADLRAKRRAAGLTAAGQPRRKNFSFPLPRDPVARRAEIQRRSRERMRSKRSANRAAGLTAHGTAWIRRPQVPLPLDPIARHAERLRRLREYTRLIRQHAKNHRFPEVRVQLGRS